MNTLKEIFGSIFLLFKIFILWVIICTLITFISMFFKIPIVYSEQIVIAIIFILNGILGTTIIRKIFKKHKIYKLAYLLFSYVAPACSILIGVSLILNLFII